MRNLGLVLFGAMAVAVSAKAQTLPPPAPILMGPATAPAATGDPARDAFNRGQAARNRGDYAAAIAALDESIRLRPDVAAPYAVRAGAWMDKGDLDRAIADYDAYLSREPGDVVALQNRGLAWFYKGRPDLAVADYDRANAIAPSAHVYELRGDALVGKGDLDGALSSFDRAVALSDRGGEAGNLGQYLAGRCEIRLRRSEWSLAIADCDAALATPAKPIRARYYRGLARLKLGETEAGKADLAAVEAQAPGLGAQFAAQGLRP